MSPSGTDILTDMLFFDGKLQTTLKQVGVADSKDTSRAIPKHMLERFMMHA